MELIGRCKKEGAEELKEEWIDDIRIQNGKSAEKCVDSERGWPESEFQGLF